MNAASPSGPQKRIFICDDNQDILDLTDTILSSAGYQVTQANGHAALIPLIKSSVPDLLILDIRMPEMDGFDIIEKLQELHIAVPIFIVTAHDHFMYRNYAPVAGARAYFTKPVDYDALLLKIKEVIG